MAKQKPQTVQSETVAETPAMTISTPADTAAGPADTGSKRGEKGRLIRDLLDEKFQGDVFAELKKRHPGIEWNENTVKTEISKWRKTKGVARTRSTSKPDRPDDTPTLDNVTLSMIFDVRRYLREEGLTLDELRSQLSPLVDLIDRIGGLERLRLTLDAIDHLSEPI